MTTEYHQITSQQGVLPLPSSLSLDASSPDPWLASATSSFSTLSVSDNWNVKKMNKSPPSIPPSLFDAGDVDSISWTHIVPSLNSSNNTIKAPKVPKGFTSTTSKIDAWSVTSPDNNKINKVHKRTASIDQQSIPSPTADDKPIEDEIAGQNRYKTELCKSFNETGNCRYGTKCQFAHGKEEIRSLLRHPKYKTEICKTFHTTGTCPYGIRCRFIHTRSKEDAMMAILKQQQQQINAIVNGSNNEVEEDGGDDGVTTAHPPGIPVPQWSKSWSMQMSSPNMQRKNFRASSDRLTQPEPAF